MFGSLRVTPGADQDFEFAGIKEFLIIHGASVISANRDQVFGNNLKVGFTVTATRRNIETVESWLRHWERHDSLRS